MAKPLRRKVSGVGMRIVDGPKKSLYVLEVSKRKKGVSKKKRELSEVTTRGGKKVKRWVSKKKYLREVVERPPKEEYYRGYVGRPGLPVRKEYAITKYDPEFAEEQKARMKREPTPEERKKIEAEALIEGIDVSIKVPSKWKKKVQKEVGPAFETKTYQAVKGVALSAKKAFEEKSKQEMKAKARAGGAAAGVGISAIDSGAVFKFTIIIIIIVLILSFLSWLSNLF